MKSEIKQKSYCANDLLRNVVDDNALLLPVLTRFGISLGFGDRTVAETCALNDVHTPTFLAVINFFSNKEYSDADISVASLTNYLKDSHTYFLDYMLPSIRRKIIDAIANGTTGDKALVFLKFYDEYVNEVRRHMEYEDLHVFKYVESLLAGVRQKDFNIGKFRENHPAIAEKLHELKDILICHFNADSPRADLLNTVLFDIIICERDLIQHCSVEDQLFIPAVERLEESGMAEELIEVAQTNVHEGLDNNGDVVLTAREREILQGIALGLSNKEIANKYFLSVNTVTTHRRNICNKLNIHSASGMTVYAILHNIISLDELK